MSKAAFKTAMEVAIKASLTSAGFDLTEGEADVMAEAVADAVGDQVNSYLNSMLTAGIPTPTDGGAALKSTMQAFLAIP